MDKLEEEDRKTSKTVLPFHQGIENGNRKWMESTHLMEQKCEMIISEERIESLYIIINFILHVQDEALYRVGYANLRKKNIQLSCTRI